MGNGTHTPVLISFSGIDGAGKSTQIEALRSRCEQAGLRVELLRFWDDIAQLKRLRENAGHKILKGDPGVGSPEAPIERKDKNVRSPWLTALRLGFYLLDALALRSIVQRISRSPADVVIFDRYLWDELANLNLRNPLLRRYARLLAGLVPRPRISFILDADPVAARARKPEYPLEWLEVNREVYLSLDGLLGGMTIIPAQALSGASARVQKLAAEALRKL